jgi:hypothetical protein
MEAPNWILIEREGVYHFSLQAIDVQMGAAFHTSPGEKPTKGLLLPNAPGKTLSQRCCAPQPAGGKER